MEKDTKRHVAAVGIPPGVENGVVVRAACRQCDYNLRGLKVEGVCPECGTPIQASLRGNALADANPAWLTQCVRGIWWLIGAMAILIVLQMLWPFLAPQLTTRMGQLGATPGILANVTPLLMPAALLVGVIAACFGTRLLTIREPGRIDPHPREEYVRLVARWSVWCAPAGLIVMFGEANSIRVGVMEPFGALATERLIIGAALLWPTVAGLLFTLVRVADLARRSGRRKLPALIDTTSMLLTLTLGVNLLIFTLEAISGQRALGSVSVPEVFCGCGGFLIFIALGVVLLGLLQAVAGELNKALERPVADKQ